MNSPIASSWAKARILTFLIPLRDRILKLLRRTDFETIYFEGGLGSQILAYIEFVNSPRQVDFSYFRHTRKRDSDGPDVWEWELDRYGITIDGFKQYEKNKPFNPWITRRPSTLEFSKILQFDSRLQKLVIPKNVQEIFPINYTELSKILEKHKLSLDKTIVIHVRRGDYVRVASRLIKYEEYTNLLKTINFPLNFELVFLSDSELSEEVKTYFKEMFPNRILKFYSEKDMSNSVSHDIMRMCKVLITANSTFSISAGLLSDENTIVFSPLEFFGGEDGYMQSRIFNRYGNFLVMQRDFGK